ncbi:MAG: type IA DNA topoisomerase [Candidatus Thermoplasmatota archaeon]|nr:type IA DNA topoisomerase [Candidatus Thermoplasmatota archaeon]
MKLVILESGAKAKTIKKYLGKGWIVDACNGHVQDLPSGRKTKDSSKAMWASKPGELPQPPWSWTDRAERVMSKIKSKAKKSGVDEVYIATDPDREGEFIAWRLGEILSEFDSVKRVTFNEITKDAVSAAISSPSELDMDLVEAAIVRRLMDRLVGFRCSKFCRSWKLKSMGRVQTPTLGYIVEKEIEREAHVPKEYNSVSALSNGVELKVRFHESNDSEAWKDDDGKHFPDRTSNTEIAKLAFDIINTKRSLKLETVKEGNVNRKPKAPFTTDTMLQTSSSTLGWSISKTSKVASILYQAGHITYIRTDSTRTNANARGEIRKYIESNFGQDFIGDGVGESGKSKGGVQDAHEAIRPTIPSLLDVGEDRDEKALYRLIWSRFAASQMSNSIRERRSLTFSCDGLDKPIIGTSTWRTHSGWEEVFSWLYNEVQTNPPEIGFATGSNWQIDGDAELTIDFTKPPRRFTESSIIQQMKKDGIGRPSTYVSTVSKLVERKYVDKDGSSLIPTLSGRTLWIEVAPYYNQTDVYNEGLFTYGFTSSMEEKLDLIENGEVNAADQWTHFVDTFRDMHNTALEKRREKPTVRQIQFLQGILDRMSEKQRIELVGENSVEELSGDQVREIIDGLDESTQSNIPPSEKQIATILKISDRLKIDLDGFLKEIGEADINSLTGGRGGTASEAIGMLIELDKNSPATEKQVSTIISMTESLEMAIEDAIAAVNAESIDVISKSDASTLIGNLKKTINSKRKAKK